MARKFTNNASGRLTSPITDSETTIVVGGQEGDRFPSLLEGDTFQATLVDEDGNREIVKVTARTSNTLTVERGQEGTIARSFPAGSLVSHRLTAEDLADFAQQNADNTFAGNQTFASSSFKGPQRFIGDASEVTWVVDIGEGPPSPNPDQILGHDFRVTRCDATSAVIDVPFSIDRTTGEATLPYVPNIDGRKADAFPSGTRMLFQQTNAPVGWTKVTEHNDKALRVVSGTASSGGNISFSTAFANRTISQANLPNVNLTGSTNTTGNHTHSTIGANLGTGGGGGGANTMAWGGSHSTSSAGAHSHTVTVALGGSGTPMDFRVQYVDIIIAEKD